MNPNNIKMSELQKKKVLGEGTFGRVELVYHPRTKTSWALKTQMKVQIAEAKQQKACMLEKGYGVSEAPFHTETGGDISRCTLAVHAS